MNNTVEYVDFNKICRLCLRKTDLSPLFDLLTRNISNHAINFVWMMLQSYVKFKISKGDDKPQNICNQCLSQIFHSYHFLEMCVVSNNVLDEALRHRNSKKLETIDLTGPEQNLNPINYPVSIPYKIVVKIIQEEEPHLEENDPLIIDEDCSKIDLKEIVCEYDQSLEEFNYDTDNDDVSEDYKYELNLINSCISNCEENIVKIEDDQGPPALSTANGAKGNNAKSGTADEHNYSISINYSCTEKKKKVARKIKVEGMKTSPKKRINVMPRKSHFTCQICKEIFVTFKDVIDHFDKVHEGSTRCILCDKLLRNKSTKLLKYHMNKHIQRSSRYDCIKCFQYFLTRTEMVEHYRSTEHNADPKVCKICNKRYRTRVVLKRHMLSHSNEKKNQCAKCGKCFKYGCNLYRHVQVSHKGVRLLCNFCGNIFTTKIALNNHIRAIHEGHKKPARVAQSEWVPRKRHRKRNIETITEDDDRSTPKQCRFCEQEFDSIFGRDLHTTMKHASERQYPCIRCMAVFPSSKERNAHMDNVHYKYKCSYCKRGFSIETVFKQHMERHAKPGFTRCIHCNLECRTQVALKLHMNTHTGERPFKCDKCNKAFRQPAHLRHHQFMHTRKKHFKCHLCKKIFGLEPSLKSHMNTHEGKRPFPCNLCEKAYINKGTLTKHIKKIHGVEKHT